MEEKDCCPIEQTKRQQYLSFLYTLEGRQFPEHPYHATYTGLAENRKKHLYRQDMLRMTEKRQ